METAKAEVFLSYCWADGKIADEIYDNLIRNAQINLHRDTLDIGKWGSIKEYMQSIPQMDYTVLLISESYLKSSNCMYEVLEVMRDHKYKDKIFPAVIYTGIYDPLIRAGFVKYWQDELAKLKTVLSGIETQNLGPLTEDLKHRQDIAANIATFMGMVADMNNPKVDSVASEIEKRLQEKGISNYKNRQKDDNENEAQNVADAILKVSLRSISKITDLDINRFMVTSYSQIRTMLETLCQRLQKENPEWTVVVAPTDTRNCIYDFYKNGKNITNLKVSLNDSFGNLIIAVARNSHAYASGTAWNGIYDHIEKDGKLMLESLFSMRRNSGDMEVKDVVEDIWMSYVEPYLN